MAQSAAPSAKLSAELAAKEPLAQCNVIVQWKHTPTESTHQKVVSLGGSIRRRYTTVPFGAYSIQGSALQDLANDSEVAFIAIDRPGRIEINQSGVLGSLFFVLSARKQASIIELFHRRSKHDAQQPETTGFSWNASWRGTGIGGLPT